MLSELGFGNRRLRMKAIERNLYSGLKGVYYADFTIFGKRIRKSLWTTDKTGGACRAEAPPS